MQQVAWLALACLLARFPFILSSNLDVTLYDDGDDDACSTARSERCPFLLNIYVYAGVSKGVSADICKIHWQMHLQTFYGAPRVPFGHPSIAQSHIYIYVFIYIYIFIYYKCAYMSETIHGRFGRL